MTSRKPQGLPDPAGFNELRARIVERYPHLSQQQRQIATFALAHPDTMAMETAEQLAARLSVQPSAMVRFAHALGYGGFREMKQRFRASLVFMKAPPRSGATGAPAVLAHGRAGQGDEDGNAALLGNVFARGIAELTDLETRFDVEAFRAGVRLLRKASAIYVTAQHLAYPFASVFSWMLIHGGRECLILDNTGGYALPQARLLDRDGLLVAVSLAPYQASVVQAAQAHAGRGGDVLAISDTPLSPLAPFATALIELPPPAAPAQPTHVGLLCVIQALVLALDLPPAEG